MVLKAGIIWGLPLFCLQIGDKEVECNPGFRSEKKADQLENHNLKAHDGYIHYGP